VNAPPPPDAVALHSDAAAEEPEPRRFQQNLERLTLLPSTWQGLDPTAIVQSLFDTLHIMLELDFVGLRFSETEHIFLRLGQAFGAATGRDDVAKAIECWLQSDPADRPVRLRFGEGELSVVALPLGAIASMGILLAGSLRSGFPASSDMTTLNIAAMQASLACREVRELSARQTPADFRTEKLSGDALARSEWELNLAINTIPAMVWSTTADGRLDFCNQHLLDFVGLTFEEISGLGFYRIYHPDDIPHVLAAWQDIMAAKRGREVEGRIRRGDGTYQWFTLRQNPLLDADGAVVKWYGAIIDIDDRKRAEDSLRETETALLSSEQNLTLIIDSLPVLIWSARPDGSADFINKRWLEYAGLPAEKILDWGFLDLYHPDDIPGMLEIWKRDLEKGDETQLKGRVLGADGTYRWFYFRGSKLTDANGAVRWYGANVDIDDLQRAEDALRAGEAALQQSELELQQIVETIPAMAWSAGPDGMLEFWNRNLSDFVGLSFDQIVGIGFYRIFHPDDVEPMRVAWENTLATKQPQDIDGRIRRADGEYRWFTLRQNPLLDAYGNVVKWYGIIIDIEDRKRAEDALRASEARLQDSERELQQIVSSIPGLAWSSDSRGATTFWSQQYLDYAGLRSEEVLGWGFLDHIHPDDSEHMLEVWSATLQSGAPGEAEARLRRADGQFRWFLIRASPFYDTAGNLTQWFGVNIDIENRKRAEEQLRQSQTELAHVTRMMTMDELAVSIAHEVNQPLMAIVTNAGTCLRWLDDGQLNVAMAREAAVRIVRDGHRAGEIVTSIRALARKAAPRMEKLDLETVIQEVLDLLRGELQRRGVASKTEFWGEVPSIYGDPTQLQQVVLNLVMNGIEAMAQVDEGDRRLTVRTDVAAGHAQVSVQDTGTGLDPDSGERMFEAFFSTKPEGIGMGLSICRSIVEAHGGRIRAANNPVRGSMFSFTLPLVEGALIHVPSR